jgi:RHS repeat-associated protein
MAQTKTSGTWEGVWEPDHFGNYRYKWSTSPARPELGLTGKMWDASAGLYYFNARWLDPERGRWASKDPLGYTTGNNLYQFVRADALNYVDPTGLREWPWFLGGSCCNNSNHSVPALRGGMYYWLAPGECLEGDCDGMWCNGTFYAVGAFDELNCKNDGTYDSDVCWDDRVQPPSPPDNPVDRGAPSNDPPWNPDLPRSPDNPKPMPPSMPILVIPTPVVPIIIPILW